MVWALIMMHYTFLFSLSCSLSEGPAPRASLVSFSFSSAASPMQLTIICVPATMLPMGLRDTKSI